MRWQAPASRPCQHHPSHVFCSVEAGGVAPLQVTHVTDSCCHAESDRLRIAEGHRFEYSSDTLQMRTLLMKAATLLATSLPQIRLTDCCVCYRRHAECLLYPKTLKNAHLADGVGHLVVGHLALGAHNQQLNVRSEFLLGLASRALEMHTLLMVAATLLSATLPCCPLVDGVRPLCATPSFSANKWPLFRRLRPMIRGIKSFSPLSRRRAPLVRHAQLFCTSAGICTVSLFSTHSP